VQLAEALMEVQVQLAEAKAYIAELKRQLFGSKGEPLSAEQEAQLEQLADDAQEQAKKPCAGQPGGARRRRAGQKGET